MHYFAEDDSVDADLLQMASFEVDKTFEAFKKQIKKNPGQVLRYQQNGEPLWLSDEHRPSDADIPPCTYCGSPRVFEFQVMLFSCWHFINLINGILFTVVH